MNYIRVQTELNKSIFSRVYFIVADPEGWLWGLQPPPKFSRKSGQQRASYDINNNNFIYLFKVVAS